MAFIVPVIRRDFPIYNTKCQHSPHALVQQKRRCESVPVNFHCESRQQNVPPSPPMASSLGIKEKHGAVVSNAADTPPANCPSSTLQRPSSYPSIVRGTCVVVKTAAVDDSQTQQLNKPTQQQQQPQRQEEQHSSELAVEQSDEQQPMSLVVVETVENCIDNRWEWLFPNKRVSFTLLDNDDDDEFVGIANVRSVPLDQIDEECAARSPQEQQRQRRVRFGMCERVEYDQEDTQHHEQQLLVMPQSQSGHNQENHDPNMLNARIHNLRSCLRAEQQLQQSISGGRRRAASIPAQQLMVRPMRRVRTHSIPSSPPPMGVEETEAGDGDDSSSNVQRAENIGNEMSTCIRNGKCNAVLFRLLSSLRSTSKM